jgi:hypothetical protein
MSRHEVRAALGEPLKIQGGIYEYWMYSDRGLLGPGRVSFYRGEVLEWTEP